MNILLAVTIEQVRTRLRQAISKNIGPDHIMEAPEPATLATNISAQQIDMLIIDSGLLRKISSGILKSLRPQNPKLKILAIAYGRDYSGMMYLDESVNGICMATEPVSELSQAIEAVSRGRTFVSNEISRFIIGKTKRKDAIFDPKTALTDRQREILDLMLDGYTTLEISQALHLHISTVSTVKKRILDKASVTNVIELMQRLQVTGQLE